VGHNPNSIDDVNAALDAGANAIEPDVNVYSKGGYDLCISHNEGDADAPSLAQYIEDLRGVALRRPELALVVFDCKEEMIKAAPHDLASELLSLIQDRLTPVGLNVIISIADLKNIYFFDQIRNRLGPRVGVMVDSDNDPNAVSNAFHGVANECYGNGITDVGRAPTFAPHIRPSIERACALRAELGQIKFIYTWSLGLEDVFAMEEYIRIGVDGIIAGFRPEVFDSPSVTMLRAVAGDGRFQSMIRLATREDNPFTPSNAAYALTVHTDSRHNAGTDANVTFTVTGTFGSSSKTVDTSLIGSLGGGVPGRMENGLDYVTLPSTDLGDLKSITVQRDDQGNAPGWYLNWIRVQSFRYGVSSKQAFFERWIDTTSPFTQPLV
jgi:hypothetical protein